MRKSNLLKLLSIIFTFALIAGACGGDDDDSSSSSDSSVLGDDSAEEEEESSSSSSEAAEEEAPAEEEEEEEAAPAEEEAAGTADDSIQGDGAESLREKGGEYGTTTGRPRRVGWLDLVQVRQAVRVNGLTEIALTKLDVLNGFEELPVCIAYNVEGKQITEMPASLTQYRKATPIYERLAGWGDLPEKIWEKGYDALPQTLKHYIDFIESEVGCPVKIVSVGPQRHETIIR